MSEKTRKSAKEDWGRYLAKALRHTGSTFRPPMEAVRAFEDVDHAGKPALRVFIIVPDSSTDEDLSYENVTPIEDAIFDAVMQEEPTLWPYVRFVRHSEAAAQAVG